MTLSIVAMDPQTGELGVAVQSAYFAVGAFVPWLRPGVGAVASQAITEPAHGPSVLDRLASGDDPTAALGKVIESDPQRQIRQVGVVDGSGKAAVHTGSRCIPHAGHAIGVGVTIQCNLATSERSWDEMLEAFEASAGSLAERMLQALLAGDRGGGDLRGRQSAALAVVSGDSEQPPWRRTFDLRVDDHRAPLDELARLLEVHRAYAPMGDGIGLLFDGRPEQALPDLAVARAMRPGDAQACFWEAIALRATGRPEAAAELLDQAVHSEPGWRLVWDQLEDGLERED